MAEKKTKKTNKKKTTKKTVQGYHPITKQPLYSKDVNAMSKTSLQLKKELIEKFKDVPEITLLHLAIAISLSYPIYVTANPILLDNKEQIKKDYNIQVGELWEFSQVMNGALI
jgi:hypothetical protein